MSKLSNATVTSPLATVLLGIWLSAVAACGVIQPVSSSSAAPMSYRPSSVLTSQEISHANGGSAYDLIAQMRPSFLNATRGATGFGERRVYVDGICVGGLAQLRMIPSMTVREVRFLNASDATTLYGMGNSGGAVMIITGPAPDR